MQKQFHLIPVSAQFWEEAAHQFLLVLEQGTLLSDEISPPKADFSEIRVVVSTYEHAQLFLRALSEAVGKEYIPPRIQTMFAWRAMQIPDGESATSESERLMNLYGELRQHAWLKKLFSAKRNTDLLPLAQTLLNLSDELTQTWLPRSLSSPQLIQDGWHQALSQLPLPVQKLVSDETQLVWTLWQSQLDGRDELVKEFRQLMQIAKEASAPLVWIAPILPNAIESAFLNQYQELQQVMIFSLDWRETAIDLALLQAWPDLRFSDSNLIEVNHARSGKHVQWEGVRLCEATFLEDEAEQAAQTVVDWLLEGKQQIAVIAQDRIVSRRLRALLERAQVFVTDETGWKLSTTRAAASLAAWFEVVASRADTIALLDFLKSPFLPLTFSAQGHVNVENSQELKSNMVMAIELALRRNNVLGSWELILSCIENISDARQIISHIARLAKLYQATTVSTRRSLSQWVASTLQIFEELGMQSVLSEDLAGKQVLQMLQIIDIECQSLPAQFNFSEWRAFINMRLESTPFVTPQNDQRVVMLPLNGARLRHFDAVLVLGADAKHLPSRTEETLFFTNAVRRECGLVTREQRQQQQLRDLAEVLLSNDIVVLSWQTELKGEHNPKTPWLEQLDLMLARMRMPPLDNRKKPLRAKMIWPQKIYQPRPNANTLMPTSLSASGLGSLIACPYQFFAERMLKLSAIDEFVDMPEKRDYGDWLHTILKSYHDQLQTTKLDMSQREELLSQISDALFSRILEHNPSALGFRSRWRKVIPVYVEWANAREASGWVFEVGEKWLERRLSWGDGDILLRGRIDRIDRRDGADGNAEYAILDYKTKRKSELKRRLKSFEDHQLPFYGLLTSDQAAHASYVALELEKETLGDVSAENYDVWKRELEQSVLFTLQEIQRGSGLPSNGVESVCQYCAMRGLCRKGAWS